MIGATLEDLQKRLDHALQTLSNKEGEVIKLKEEFDDLNELCTTRQVQIDSITNNLESAQKVIVRQSYEIEELKQLKNRIDKVIKNCEEYPLKDNLQFAIILKRLRGDSIT